jgi:xanthine phosphoribosyltransferase
MMGSGYNKMFPVSWDELHRHCKAMAWRLAERTPFIGLIAITRGGLVPAAIVARELDLRLIDTVCCAAYDKLDRAGKVKMMKHPHEAMKNGGENWLLVDDLVDTGITAKAVRELLPKAHFATIYAKPAGRPMVDTYITEVSQDTWILFPWDQEATLSKPVIELKGNGGGA